MKSGLFIGQKLTVSEEKATFCIFIYTNNWVNGKKRSLNILTILMALILSVIDECYIWHALIIHDLMNAHCYIKLEITSLREL
ncbi:unnamed protein product [Rhizophagus irregularis]|nr:unnamed protein product [Rhizophagus irregularis]